MVFEFLFYNQQHKSRNGYFLNHDNLMLATPEERQKLILYFIANQVPEKLDPVDRVTFNNEQQSHLIAKGRLMGTLTGLVGLAGFPYVATRINKRLALNITIAFLACPMLYYVGNQLTYSVWEPKFVANNKTVETLAQKYKFTIFDFAQAKKEAHLKALRTELVSDNLISNPGL